MEGSYQCSDLTPKTSVCKRHTQTAFQRYTHIKSLAKIDIQQTLRLPSADKHCLWVNAAHTLWDSATLHVPFFLQVNVLKKVSHQDRQCCFKGWAHFLLWLSMQWYCRKKLSKSLTLKAFKYISCSAAHTFQCMLAEIIPKAHEIPTCCLMVLHYE